MGPQRSAAVPLGAKGAELGPVPDPDREAAPIIFFGDSITRDWPLRDVLGPGFRNAGVAGETTGQMRRRFEADVLMPRPAVLHLLAGINDIAENAGPVTPEEIAGNLHAMAEAARAQGIAVVLGLLLPCAAFVKHPRIDPRPALARVNGMIRRIAEAHAFPLADYFDPLLEGRGALRADCTADGLHPNEAGYALMNPVARAALAATGRVPRVAEGGEDR